MSTLSLSTDHHGPWLCYGRRDPFNSRMNLCNEENHLETQTHPWFKKLRTSLFPLALIQTLGFTQALTQISSLALINNAVQKPILEYLLRSIILLMIGNPILLWSYGLKNYGFVYEARSWACKFLFY